MSLWVKNSVCYRCSQTGIVPYLSLDRRQSMSAKTGEPTASVQMYEKIASCDCKKAKKFQYKIGDKEIKHKSYWDIFGNDHQFPFATELINICEPPMTYGESFMLYSYHNFKLFNEMKEDDRKDFKIDVESIVMVDYLMEKKRVKPMFENQIGKIFNPF